MVQELGTRAWYNMDLEKYFSTIKVLWKKPGIKPGELWGIPELKGETPQELFDRGETNGWLYFGYPGYWERLTPKTRKQIQDFLELHKDKIPGIPGEWRWI